MINRALVILFAAGWLLLLASLAVLVFVLIPSPGWPEGGLRLAAGLGIGGIAALICGAALGMWADLSGK